MKRHPNADTDIPQQPDEFHYLMQLRSMAVELQGKALELTAAIDVFIEPVARGAALRHTAATQMEAAFDAVYGKRGRRMVANAAESADSAADPKVARAPKKTGSHRISPEGLKRIRDAQKRRWAAAKAAGSPAKAGAKTGNRKAHSEASRAAASIRFYTSRGLAVPADKAAEARRLGVAVPTSKRAPAKKHAVKRRGAGRAAASAVAPAGEAVAATA